MATKKKRYTWREVQNKLEIKFPCGDNYLNHTQNSEPDMKYRFRMKYYRTLNEIVEMFNLDEIELKSN